MELSLDSLLVELYGKDAVKLTTKEIKELELNSNIPFDKPYIAAGIEFLGIYVLKMTQGTEPKSTLKALVSKSFGEAAIYKYNCCNDTL